MTGRNPSCRSFPSTLPSSRGRWRRCLPKIFGLCTVSFSGRPHEVVHGLARGRGQEGPRSLGQEARIGDRQGRDHGVLPKDLFRRHIQESRMSCRYLGSAAFAKLKRGLGFAEDLLMAVLRQGQGCPNALPRLHPAPPRSSRTRT